MPEYKTLEFTLTGNNGAPGTVEVQISDTYSAVNNTSTLQVSRVRFKRDNFSGVSTAIDGQILINGNSVATFSNVFITSSASYVTVSPTSTSSLSVLHNNDGSLSVSVMLIKNGSAYQGFTAFMTGYTAYTIWSNESKTLTLTTQPRESGISSCTANVTTQGTIALTMNRKMDSATHIATITSGGVTLYTSSSFAASINITAARTWFASFPTATSITATVSVQTYMSGTAIGSPQTATVVVAADDGMKPTVASGWVSMSRVQATAAASIAAYVKGYSSARFSFDTSEITMASGATISSYSVVYGGITKSGAGTITTDRILNTGSVTFTVYVTDSRGRYASSTFTVTVYDYSSPTLTGISVFRAESDGTAKDDGTYISLTATANISSVNSLNSYTLTAAYKALNGSYGSETAMTSGTALIIGGGLIAANASYSARITLTDALGNTATFEQVIPTAKVAFNIRLGGTGAAFGNYAETDNELQMPEGWKIKIGNSYLSGGVNTNLLDNWYFGNPVNQRGVTSWSGGYGIDRWIATVPTSCANGKIQITESGSFYQRIENVSQYFGRVMTISALLDGGMLLTGTWTLQNSNKNIVISEHLVLSYNTGYQFLFYARDNSAPAIIAVKVELGSQQTLAHQENGVWVLNEIPNFQAELLKCKRYFTVADATIFGIGGTCYCRTLPTENLRAIPAVENWSAAVNGVVYSMLGSQIATIMGIYTPTERGAVTIYISTDIGSGTQGYISIPLRLSADL